MPSLEMIHVTPKFNTLKWVSVPYRRKFHGSGLRSRDIVTIAFDCIPLSLAHWRIVSPCLVEFLLYSEICSSSITVDSLRISIQVAVGNTSISPWLAI